jgi:L-alanine-DL-glutamate epimerase-like enolase superfamily enzyme
VKISAVTTATVELPLSGVATADHSFGSIGCVLVEVHADAGLHGEGFVYAADRSRLRALELMIESLSPLLMGRDPHDNEVIWHDMWRALNATGRSGATVLAMSALDTACWDLAGKAVELPLHKLFGACRSDVDTYASSGLFLSTPIDALGAEALHLVAQGFRTVKVRLGSGNVSGDVERVEAVRDAVGPDIGILVDVNQALRPKAAIRLGRALESLDVGWFEDPVSSDDLAGLAAVRAAVALPVVAGEAAFTRVELGEMINAGSIDLVMPDLQRVGGLSEFRKVSAVAATAHLPVSSHFFTEYSLCLAGSIDAVVSIEHIDWFAPLFRESVELRDGRLVIADRPGTGFTFDPAAVEAHRIG